MAELLALTEETFAAETATDAVPVLVDFWAPWCGSCRLLMPAVSQVADELSSQVRVVKVDVDEQSSLAEQLGIMSIPTLVLYRSGEEVARIAGVKSKAALVAAIQPHLAS